MSRVREAVVRSWDGSSGREGTLVSLLTTPLSWVWGWVTALRNHRYDRTPPREVRGLKVVSVGNLAAGGTGKTPLTAWVARRIMERGRATAVVLSGYGEDEVLLHRRWNPRVLVLSDRDRSAALVRARDAGASAAVLDDGFQHRAAPRDLDIVLLAAEHPFPGPMMPRGPYREPIEALRRADAVVITRRTADRAAARRVADAVRRVAPQVAMAGVHLAPDRWLDLHGAPVGSPTGPLYAVAAVARPETFVAAVRAAVPPGTELEFRGFRDHHAYTRDDLMEILAAARGRPVVATEKDAVKLEPLATDPGSFRVLASRVIWDWGESDVLRLLDAALDGGGS